ncbi:MAG: DinB family protein [Acidobacteria bacterium]|nr:DinB family protein [Acidobacteriota bacterium]
MAFSLVLLLSASALAENGKPAPTLKVILLEQLHSTHDKAEWFVPAATAIEGLTAEQAAWTDGKGNHSVGQLVSHLVFWNRRALEDFKGEPKAKYSGNNDDTFNYDSGKWEETRRELDKVMTDWEKAVESADDAKLKDWYSNIAHVGTHNAYHIGEIVMVRKEQGSWNPEKGVK